MPPGSPGEGAGSALARSSSPALSMTRMAATGHWLAASRTAACNACGTVATHTSATPSGTRWRKVPGSVSTHCPVVPPGRPRRASQPPACACSRTGSARNVLRNAEGSRVGCSANASVGKRAWICGKLSAVNDHGIGTLFFRAKGTPAFGVERHAGKRPIRRSWLGLHSLIGRD